jgi:hypothetical protein
MFRSTTFIPVVAAVASLLATAAPAGAHYDNPGSKYCGYVVFEQNTDSGASGIESKGVSCSKAKRMARAVNRGNNRPFGFSCRSRAHDAANFIAHSDVRCKSGRRVVTWIAT